MNHGIPYSVFAIICFIIGIKILNAQNNGDSLNLILNGSFEEGELHSIVGESNHITVIDNWLVNGNQFGLIGTSSQYQPTHAERLLVFNGGNDTFTGTVSQTFETTPGSIYTLAMDVGIFTNGVPNLNQRLQIHIQGDRTLRTILASRTSTSVPGSFAAQWQPFVVNFTATHETTTLTLSDASQQLSNNSNADLVVDNVRVFEVIENTPPMIGNDQFNTHKSFPLSVSQPGVLLNDRDPDGRMLVAIKRSEPSHGTLLLSPNGAFTYIPMANFTGLDSFTYEVSDGETASTPATVTITVTEDPSGQLSNGSFEYGSRTSDSSFELANWEVQGPVISYETDADYDAKDGVRMAVLNAGSNVYNSSITQTFPTVTGQAYTLSFDMGIVGPPGVTQRLLTTVNGPLGQALMAPQQSVLSGPSRWIRHNLIFIADSDWSSLKFLDGSGSLQPGQTAAFSDLLLDNIVIAPIAAARSLFVSSSQPTLVSITPSDYAGNTDGLTNLVRSYPHGSSVTITASSTLDGRPFYRWLRNGIPISTSQTINLQMTDHDQLRATYASDSYHTWIKENDVMGGPTDDPDQDSLVNSIEFLVGGNPHHADRLDREPKGSFVMANFNQGSGEVPYMLFSYHRSSMAENDPFTHHAVEWNSGLTGAWTNANQTPGVVITELPSAAGNDTDIVNVYIPSTVADRNRLFARLRVVTSNP